MLAPSWYPSQKQLRQFAIISLFGFGLFGLAVYFRFHWPVAACVLWIVGGLTFVAGMIAPGSVLPVYTVLMAVTLPIGWIVSNVFLMLLYYVLMTPVAVVFRLMGRDPLRLRKPQGTTYWIDHPQRPAGAGYYRQS